MVLSQLCMVLAGGKGWRQKKKSTRGREKKVVETERTSEREREGLKKCVRDFG